MAKGTGALSGAAQLITHQRLILTKQRSYALMHIGHGCEVLDLGCGPGTDTIPLGDIVGSSGHVVGVDQDAGMITEADRQASQAGINRWVTHKLANFEALPFRDNFFNACRSERVFQRLPRPGKVLSELIRVARPGGWIVILDNDWATLSVDTPEIDIERRFNRFVSEHYLSNGFSGRTLYRLFKNHGLADITVEGFVNTTTSYAAARQMMIYDKVEQAAVDNRAVNAEELRRYYASLDRADAEGTFFASLSGFIAVGRKPDLSPTLP